MLTLLIALSVAGVAPQAATLPKKARATAARKRTAPKAAVRALPQPANLCLTGSCTPVVETSYRLTSQRAPEWSAKMDAVRSTGLPCGLLGAPVCPKRGKRLRLLARID